VDFVTKFEKELRKRHHTLMTEVANIEHLIDAFEKGAKRGAKGTSRGKLTAAGRKNEFPWRRRLAGRREKRARRISYSRSYGAPLPLPAKVLEN